VDYEIQDAAVSASVIRLENTPGVEATWDLYKLQLSAGVDYDAFNSLTAFYRYSDSSAELFNAKAAFLPTSTSKIGIEGGGGFTAYSEHLLNNDTHFSVGPFYEARLTPNLYGGASFGLLSYQFDPLSAAANQGDFTSYYATFSLTHRVTAHFSQSLIVDRLTQRGINADISEENLASYQATWQISQKGSALFQFLYVHGLTSGGANVQPQIEEYNYDLYGPGATFGWQFTAKIAGHVAYNYLQRNAEPVIYGFTQNKVVLDVTYVF
jgi:hypothetical protein